MSLETIVAEFYRLAEMASVTPQALLPRNVLRFDIQLSRCLDLRLRDARTALGLDEQAIRSRDRTACQKVGAAAQYAGLEAIIAPSAAGRGEILAVFLDQQSPGSTLEFALASTWRRPPKRPG